MNANELMPGRLYRCYWGKLGMAIAELLYTEGDKAIVKYQDTKYVIYITDIVEEA